MPPTLKILSTPVSLAEYSISSAILPSWLGGVHKIISLQPAILAGTASIKTVEKRGAVPPGMYIPTFSIGRASCQHFTPVPQQEGHIWLDFFADFYNSSIGTDTFVISIFILFYLLWFGYLRVTRKCVNDNK